MWDRSITKIQLNTPEQRSCRKSDQRTDRQHHTRLTHTVSRQGSNPPLQKVVPSPPLVRPRAKVATELFTLETSPDKICDKCGEKGHPSRIHTTDSHQKSAGKSRASNSRTSSDTASRASRRSSSATPLQEPPDGVAQAESNPSWKASFPAKAKAVDKPMKPEQEHLLRQISGPPSEPTAPMQMHHTSAKASVPKHRRLPTMGAPNDCEQPRAAVQSTTRMAITCHNPTHTMNLPAHEQ